VFAKALAKKQDQSRQSLIEAFYEHRLKALYLHFIKKLEVGTHDPLKFVKENAIEMITDLLIGKPEQEGMLLSILVNKLGDSDKSIITFTTRMLNKLLIVSVQME
jgi:ribosome biogenesis protein MAK21